MDEPGPVRRGAAGEAAAGGGQATAAGVLPVRDAGLPAPGSAHADADLGTGRGGAVRGHGRRGRAGAADGVHAATVLEEPGKKIFIQVEQQMTDQAYSNWKIMMYESLVRACVVHYIFVHNGETAAEKKNYEEALLGFYWIKELATLLGEYEKNRKQYPNLDAFFPRIKIFFQNYADHIEDNIEAYKYNLKRNETFKTIKEAE